MTDKLTKLSWLEELYMLSQTAASVTDLEEALNLMLRHIADGFSAGSGTLALVQVDQQVLEIAAGTDLPREAIGRHILYGQGVLGKVAQEGEPMLINGTLDASKTSRPSGPLTRRVPSSSMCWPLKLKGNVMGVLAVNRFEPQQGFDDKDLQRGGIMVNMLALVIENLRMHREQKQRIAHLSDLNEKMLEMNRQLANTQAQLLQQEKLASIGQLAAGIAHEINNPLGFVSSNLRSLNGYVEALIGRVLAQPSTMTSDEELQYLMEDVPILVKETSEGLERVRRIVQDLRDFSRIDAADQWEFADINAHLQSAINLGLTEFKDRIDIQTDYGDIPHVQCLLAQLNQVFLCLMINGVQAIAGKGTMTISTGVDSSRQQVWISVSDSGCGIPSENMTRIFEPFFTTKPIGKGIGLGLSLAYSIVKKHDGLLTVSSSEGHGSTFEVRLPIRH
ncbi:MAG TPA: ATP-binding protein [Aquabacterium sp.]|uniref:ATP-binding protein n=1 Tax=Aquabacterium sp. TaxID=1872578 RepID=UPI002E2EB9EB|nr:ATP-binding protein [Aquabacterium sp.]HEX5354851.1 ATP-binding protein [Aquabacterium sp.]